MAPPTPLPFSDDFNSADSYVESLLQFTAASTIFQTLCGGVHILDFFTREPSLYHTVRMILLQVCSNILSKSDSILCTGMLLPEMELEGICRDILRWV
jgi:hypothetical protein